MGLISIGCKLPHGPVLETGVDRKTGLPGKDYAYVVLNGLTGTPPKTKYAVTLVDEALWNAWARRNKSLRHLLDGSLFVVPSATVQAPKANGMPRRKN